MHFPSLANLDMSEMAFRKIIDTILSHIQKINKNYNMIRLKMPRQLTIHYFSSKVE